MKIDNDLLKKHPKLAEFVGALAGDGFIGHYGSQYKIAFAGNIAEKEYYVYINSIINSVFPSIMSLILQALKITNTFKNFIPSF